jgi:formylglycine-generating enzyme required for sulfatase activity
VAVDSEGNTATVVKNIVISNVPQSFIQVNGGTLPDSSPLGAVSVDPFHIGTYEVRWGEFQAVRTWAAANGYDIGTAGAGVGANYPVTDVNWYTALKWCNARSEMEGRVAVYWVGGAVYRTENQVPTVNATANGYRLPSEKEWEWAARGGTQTNGYTFSGGNDWNAVGWFAGNSGRAIHVVGTKRANELGTYDMTGNVFEWCFDDYDGSGAYRVVRGGSWKSSEHFWVGFRNVLLVPTLSNGPIVSNNYIGFRLALSLVP